MCGNEIKWFCVLQVLMLVLIAWSITPLKLGSRSSDIMTLFKIPVDCQQMYTTWSLLIKHSNHFHNPPTAHQQFMQTQGLTVQVGVYSNKLVFVFWVVFFIFTLVCNITMYFKCGEYHIVHGLCNTYMMNNNKNDGVWRWVPKKACFNDRYMNIM